MTNNHWNLAYATKSVNERSWTEPIPHDSLRFISECNVTSDAPIIDIGGGASFLVDELVNEKYSNVTLLDVSLTAIEETRHRLGDQATYICADITTWTPPHTYALWHDRAVFHFLTTEEDQLAYRRAVINGTTTGSFLLIGTFAPTGPESCSGLPVQRWSQHDLAEFFADDFTVLNTRESIHTTPWGSTQPFTWLVAKRK